MDAREPERPGFGKAPAVNSAKSSGLIRGLGGSSRPARFQEFWALISRCESLTALESGMLKSLQFEGIDQLQDEKAAAFANLQVVGRSLGLDRSNRDLRVRLEALEAAEKRNLAQVASILENLRSELREAGALERNLHSLRGAYSPDDARGDFFVEG